MRMTYEERTRAMCDAHRAGESFAAIGSRFGVTRARVRQIVIDGEKHAGAEERNARARAKVWEMRRNGASLGESAAAVPLTDLLLSVRMFNCFNNNGCETLRDVLACKEKELLRVPNFGRKSLREIKELVASYGIAWDELGGAVWAVPAATDELKPGKDCEEPPARLERIEEKLDVVVEALRLLLRLSAPDGRTPVATNDDTPRPSLPACAVW